MRTRAPPPAGSKGGGLSTGSDWSVSHTEGSWAASRLLPASLSAYRARPQNSLLPGRPLEPDPCYAQVRPTGQQHTLVERVWECVGERGARPREPHLTRFFCTSESRRDLASGRSVEWEILNPAGPPGAGETGTGWRAHSHALFSGSGLPRQDVGGRGNYLARTFSTAWQRQCALLRFLPPVSTTGRSRKGPLGFVSGHSACHSSYH